MCPFRSGAPGEGLPVSLKAALVRTRFARRAARFCRGKYMIFQQLRKVCDARRRLSGRTRNVLTPMCGLKTRC